MEELVLVVAKLSSGGGEKVEACAWLWWAKGCFGLGKKDIEEGSPFVLGGGDGGIGDGVAYGCCGLKVLELSRGIALDVGGVGGTFQQVHGDGAFSCAFSA